MIQRFLWGTLYGLAYMFITGAVLFAVLEHWPDGLLWLKIATGLLAQFGLGVFTYMRDPENAWSVPPGVKAAGKGLLVLALVVPLAACGPIYIKVPVGTAAVALGKGVEAYTTGKMIALQLRGEGKISDAQWEELKAIDVRARTMREELEKQLLDPRQDPDYEKILAYTSQALELMARLGLLAAK